MFQGFSTVFQQESGTRNRLRLLKVYYKCEKSDDQKKLKSRYGKLQYRHAKYVIRYEGKDKKNTHTKKHIQEHTHTNTEVSRKAYGTKAGQEYQAVAYPSVMMFFLLILLNVPFYGIKRFKPPPLSPDRRRTLACLVPSDSCQNMQVSCVYVCVYVCVCVSLPSTIPASICTFHVRVHIHTDTHTHMCVCVSFPCAIRFLPQYASFMCVFVCVRVCVYIKIYTYTLI